MELQSQTQLKGLSLQDSHHLLSGYPALHSTIYSSDHFLIALFFKIRLGLFEKKKLFIWLQQVLVAAGIFCLLCSMQDL